MNYDWVFYIQIRGKKNPNKVLKNGIKIKKVKSKSIYYIFYRVINFSKLLNPL